MAIQRGLIGETWQDMGRGPRALLACSTLAGVKVTASLGDVLFTEIDRRLDLSQLPGERGLVGEAMGAYGPVRGLLAGMGLAVALFLLIVPFLIWFLLFIGMPN